MDLRRFFVNLHRSMALFTASLNSGSNGNCYYIGNENEAILVDAGISCRETERRMARIGLSMQKVKALFISHEHTDHIAGVRVLSKKYKLPVYITSDTLFHSRLPLDESFVRPFKAYEDIRIGNLAVVPFPKQHDASEPHSFIVRGGGVTVGVLTDIGEGCEHVIDNFRQCHAVYLETNYDEKMLMEGNYPHYLKKRISGSHGHLSNAQALELFTGHRPEFMTHVFLSHLSKDNNSPGLVQDLFEQHAGLVEVVVASRYCETPVFYISGSHRKKVVRQEVSKQVTASQISLF